MVEAIAVVCERTEFGGLYWGAIDRALHFAQQIGVDDRLAGHALHVGRPRATKRSWGVADASASACGCACSAAGLCRQRLIHSDDLRHRVCSCQQDTTPANTGLSASEQVESETPHSEATATRRRPRRIHHG
jgi:hypothetical protein